MCTGTLSLKEIAEQQHGFWANGWFTWNFFRQPLGFLLFIVCAFAETNRAPFDLPECETELVGGYHTEYSSMKLGFYLFSEYINMFVSSAVMATLYFGGYNFPFMHHLGLSDNLVAILGVIALFIKIFAFIFFFMWVRWTLPPFPLRSVNGFGMEIVNTTGYCQYCYHRNCYYFFQIDRSLIKWNH